MSVKYNKAKNNFEIRHYEDLSNEEVIEGVNNMDLNDKKLSTLKAKSDKLKMEVREVDSEIQDLENYQDVVGRVTHIYNSVPVMQSFEPPSEENPNYGRFSFSSIGNYKNIKHLSAWVNANLTYEQRIKGGHIWCFKMEDGSGNEVVFLPKQYKKLPSNNGFHLDFIKMLAYEFVVNDKPTSAFERNLDTWFDMHERDKAIKDLLDS